MIEGVPSSALEAIAEVDKDVFVYTVEDDKGEELLTVYARVKEDVGEELIATVYSVEIIEDNPQHELVGDAEIKYIASAIPLLVRSARYASRIRLNTPHTKRLKLPDAPRVMRTIYPTEGCLPALAVEANRATGSNKEAAALQYRLPVDLRTVSIPHYIPIIALVIGLMPIPAYEYYILMRFIVCGFTSYLAYCEYKKSSIPWAWVLGGTAVLYNPILPVELNRGLWIVLNIATIAVLYFHSTKDSEDG